MFDNLIVSFLGDTELLAYNDTVAALFSDYRINGYNGIHLIEERKLTDAEMDELLDNMPEEQSIEPKEPREPILSSDKLKEHNARMLGIDIEDDDDDEESDDQVENILDKIIKICPETKYMIHGFKEVLAASPKRIDKKKKKAAQRKDTKKYSKPTKKVSPQKPSETPKKKVKPIDVEYGKPEKKEKQEKPEKPAKKPKVKPIEVEYGKPEKREKKEKVQKPKKVKLKPIDVEYGRTADGKEKPKTNKMKLEEIKEFLVNARQKNIDTMNAEELEKLDESFQNHKAHLDIILSGSTGANDEQKDYTQKLKDAVDKVANKVTDQLNNLRGSEEGKEGEEGKKEVDKDKEAQEKRYAEEEKMKKEREKKDTEETEEKTEEETPNKYSDVGKPKYEGFLGLMFKMFKGLADPQKKADKEELQRRIRRDWATYKKNEKFLKENKELVEMLEDKVNKKQFDADSISIFNEIVARDPNIVKEMDLERNTPDKVQLPLKKFTDAIKGLKTGKDVDNKDLANQIKEYFKKQNINITDIKIDDKNISKPIVNMEFNDWNDFLKVTNDLALKQKDLG